MAPAGGSERSLVELAAGLADRGHQLDLAYQHPGPLIPLYQRFCDSTVRVPQMHARQDRIRELPAVVRSAARVARLS
jgi:hypothetical protein